MFNHFFSAFFRGENLTTLAFPNEGKGNAFPRGRGRTLKTYALLFTVYCRRGTAKRRQHYKTHRPPLKIAAKPLPPPSAPQALSPPERSEPQPFYTTRGVSRAPFFKIAASAATTILGLKGRQTYEPYEPSGRSPVNPHTEGVSNGVRRHRHLERGCVPVWVVKALGNMKLWARRSPAPMLHEPWWSEISPLRFASVEMTIGVSADIVISSGGACSGMEDRWETIKLIAR